jgi:hypothetical protein
MKLGEEQTIGDLAPGRYRLTAGDPGAGCHQLLPATINLADEPVKPLAIRHGGSGAIRGVLLAARPIEPVVALFDVDDPAARVRIAVPDREGRFTFEELRPGSYRAAACSAATQPLNRCAGDPAGMKHVQVPAGAIVDLEL